MNWIILLEAGTVVGPKAEKLRVAKATLEKKIKTKYNIFLRREHFLVLAEYDRRIHALYLCPQLYKFDADNALVPLTGEEIGQLVAQSVQEGVVEKQPWYAALDKLPSKPILEPHRTTGVRLQQATHQKLIESPKEDRGQSEEIMKRQPPSDASCNLVAGLDSVSLQSSPPFPKTRRSKPLKQEDAGPQ